MIGLLVVALVFFSAATVLVNPYWYFCLFDSDVNCCVAGTDYPRQIVRRSTMLKEISTLSLSGMYVWISSCLFPLQVTKLMVLFLCQCHAVEPVDMFDW